MYRGVYHGGGLLWLAGTTDGSSFRPTAGGRSGSDPAAGAGYYFLFGSLCEGTLKKTHEREGRRRPAGDASSFAPQAGLWLLLKRQKRLDVPGRGASICDVGNLRPRMHTGNRKARSMSATKMSGMSKVRILGAVVAALFAALAVGCSTQRVPGTTEMPPPIPRQGMSVSTARVAPLSTGV